MKIISISKKNFRELKPLVLPKSILNTEGKIFEFEYQKQPKILKSLFHINGPLFANKLYTIEMLDSNSEYLPDSFYRPDYLISVGGEITGFTTPLAKGTTLIEILYNKTILPSEQIYYLRKIGEILEQLKNIRKYTPLKSIYLNDIHESNFIVNPNNKQIAVIDLDSCKIGENTSFPSRYLTPFSILNFSSKYQINNDEKIPGYVKANEQSDLYCYIIMILNYLYGDSINNFTLPNFYEYINYLENIGFNKELVELFSRIVIDKKNENPINYLDSITDTNVYRARKEVYNKVRRKK